MSERRRFSRIARDREPCQLRFGEATHHGWVVEESIGGLKVTGIDLLALPENQPVEITYHGISQHGICRTVGLDSDESTFSIGIMLKDKPMLAEPHGLLVGCFFSVHGFWVSCLPLTVDANGKLCIELFDGKELCVDRDSVQAFTIHQRRQMLLDDLDACQRLASLYQIDSPTPVEEIVQLEFCIPTDASAPANDQLSCASP